MSIRIGGVPYVVGAPLLTGLEAERGVELVRDLPALLIERLRRSELDVALASSIEAFRRPGYRIVSEIGICSRGAVLSVRGFRRPGGGPIRTVGVDAGSQSSVALLKILLARRLGAGTSCRFERITPTPRPDELPHDMVMLIGDHGLHADPGRRDVIDLGSMWHDWTGLPFVYAVWLVRPGVDAGAISAVLLEAHRRGCPGPGGPRGEGVYYEMGAEEVRGLERFRREAEALGLAEAGVVPEFTGARAERTPEGEG